MNQADLIILLKDLQALPKESEYVEFKVNKAFPQMIGEYLSALSNGAAYVKEPYGYLVFGIEDSTHRLVGTKFKPKIDQTKGQELELWLNINLHPRISFDIFEFEYQELSFVIFRVQRMRGQPVCFDGTPYIRIGSSKAKLYEHPQRARRLWTQDNDLAYEREISLYDLSPETVLQYIDTIGFFNLIDLPYPQNVGAVIERLIQEKIVSYSDNTYHITNLGALLFAKDISRFDELGRRALRVVFYNNSGRSTGFVKEKFARKGYAVGFVGLLGYLEENLPFTEVIVKTTRVKLYEYPLVALREIVANALIHQDFNVKGITPKIEVFSDRIEISNPGTPLIPVDRFIDHTPVNRNEILARFMYRLNFCEEMGSGFDRVIELCEQHHLPAPEIRVEDMYTKVILYGAKEFKDMSREERVRTCYSHACLKYVSNQEMTNQSLRERFGVSEAEYTSVSHVITHAINESVIKLSDPNNNSRRYSKYVPYWA